MDKRVELHCHTKMSEMTGLCDIQELILKAAEKNGGAYKKTVGTAIF